MRLLKHLFASSAKRLFPAHTLQHLTEAIAASELLHGGEICFAVEANLAPGAVLAGRQARDRALDVFANLRVWDTRDNNGVLLYLLLADHRIEIVADRGFDGLVDATQWQDVCRLIEERLRSGEPEPAVLRGIAAISDLIARHFPRVEGDTSHNELPDRPHLL